MSLMLKFPIIMRILFIFTLIPLRYFKADCCSSESMLIMKQIMLLLKKEIISILLGVYYY